MTRSERKMMKECEKIFLHGMDNDYTDAARVLSKIRQDVPRQLIYEREQELTVHRDLVKVLNFSATWYLNVMVVAILIILLILSVSIYGIGLPVVYVWSSNVISISSIIWSILLNKMGIKLTKKLTLYSMITNPS